MAASIMEPPPSPLRWSRIPFDILSEWESREKRLCFAAGQTLIGDIPEPVLAVIFSLITDPRSRNSMALACSDWYRLERATRTRLCLRGNGCDLYLIPRSFQSVERLDLSQCSPWGYSLFQSTPGAAVLIGQVLKQAFPRVRDMIIYVRDVRDIEMVAYLWPELESLKLVRWHQRPMQPEEAVGLGMELRFLMQRCRALKNLDLSQFYCWTEDIPPALEAEPIVSSNLCSLNLLKISVDGFKASELEAITKACTSLEELRIVLVFDPRYLDFVGDAALLQLATSCRKLRILHLVDGFAFEAIRGDPADGFVTQDAQIGREGLVGVFEALPLLEDLAIVLSQNVRNAGPALETLSSRCKMLRSLRLGHFHGVCRGPQLDGIALCSGLHDLLIRNSADLNDTGMVAIAMGCTRLCKLGLQSCREVSKAGLRALTSLLSGTLVDVEISCCMLMNAADTLWALQPIQITIQHLHLDCIWDTDLIEREEKGIDMPFQKSTMDFSESKTKKETVCTSADSEYGLGNNSLGARPSLSGEGIRALDESNDKSGWGGGGHSLELNVRGLDADGDCRGGDSETLVSVGRLNDGSCEGWLTLSNNSCPGDIISAEAAASVKTEKGSLTLDAELACVGASHDLHGGSSHCVETSRPPEQDAMLSISMNHSGLDLGYFGLGDFEEFKVLKDNSGDDPATGNDNSEDSGNVTQVQIKRQENVGQSPTNGNFTVGSQGVCPSGGSFLSEFCLSFRDQAWSSLKSLSLWCRVSELLSPLPIMGLRLCPSLQEVRLKVEGDARLCPKPKIPFFGLGTFATYPALSKLVLDCSEIVGFALSAPPGHMDLTLWERWYLKGIQQLNLWELDYWPPQDRDVNRRGVSMPAAGLISQCPTLRKLFVHGTINEHFMTMFLNCQNLRDVQVRVDYYPAPEDELNTEMRADSCKRFEAALAERGFPD